MAPPSFREVNHAGIAPMGFANGTGEAGFGFRNCDDVDVVGHEAVGPDGEVVFLGLFFQNVQVCTLVSLLQEDGLSAISPLYDVLRYSGCSYLCDS